MSLERRGRPELKQRLVSFAPTLTSHFSLLASRSSLLTSHPPPSTSPSPSPLPLPLLHPPTLASHLSPFTLTSHLSPFTLTSHPLPSPFTLTLHPSPFTLHPHPKVTFELAKAKAAAAEAEAARALAAEAAAAAAVAAADVSPLCRHCGVGSLGRSEAASPTARDGSLPCDDGRAPDGDVDLEVRRMRQEAEDTRREAQRLRESSHAADEAHRRERALLREQLDAARHEATRTQVQAEAARRASEDAERLRRETISRISQVEEREAELRMCLQLTTAELEDSHSRLAAEKAAAERKTDEAVSTAVGGALAFEETLRSQIRNAKSEMGGAQREALGLRRVAVLMAGLLRAARTRLLELETSFGGLASWRSSARTGDDVAAALEMLLSHDLVTLLASIESSATHSAANDASTGGGLLVPAGVHSHSHPSSGPLGAPAGAPSAATLPASAWPASAWPASAGAPSAAKSAPGQVKPSSQAPWAGASPQPSTLPSAAHASAGSRPNGRPTSASAGRQPHVAPCRARPSSASAAAPSAKPASSQAKSSQAPLATAPSAKPASASAVVPSSKQRHTTLHWQLARQPSTRQAPTLAQATMRRPAPAPTCGGIATTSAHAASAPAIGGLGDRPAARPSSPAAAAGGQPTTSTTFSRPVVNALNASVGGHGRISAGTSQRATGVGLSRAGSSPQLLNHAAGPAALSQHAAQMGASVQTIGAGMGVSMLTHARFGVSGRGLPWTAAGVLTIPTASPHELLVQV